jgi:hypothetical protein
MAITASITVVFDVDCESATFGKFIITDTSDYVGEGIALADVAGTVTVTYPDGDNTIASIAPATSLINSTIDIPQDGGCLYLCVFYCYCRCYTARNLLKFYFLRLLPYIAIPCEWMLYTYNYGIGRLLLFKDNCNGCYFLRYTNDYLKNAYALPATIIGIA